MKELFVVFEHESYFIHKGDKRLSEPLYEKLVKYYGNGKPYFKLLHQGIQFCEYVGVIQIGNYLIEVLPKADKALSKGEENGNNTTESWKELLLNMVRTGWNFPVSSTSEASLKIKQNSLLDLYFELFVKEVEYLAHLGLIKRYIKEEGNLKALKGKLLFQKHIQQNLVHKERFYTQYTHYHQDHTLNQILHTALLLLKGLNHNPLLQSRIQHLILIFQDFKALNVIEKTFSSIKYNRKNKFYQKAVAIARLLLLNYHPDISGGRNNILALMFDMNSLWEEFVATVLRRGLEGYLIRTQVEKIFWKAEGGRGTNIIPDIVIENRLSGLKYVLDTKWKNLDRYIKPSGEDLRQMYVYHEHFDAQKVALVYPGQTNVTAGYYFDKHGNWNNGEDVNNTKTCAVMQINILSNFKEWKIAIVGEITKFIA